MTNLKYPVLFNDPGYANTTQFAGLPVAVELLSNYFIFQPFQPMNENSLPATSAPDIDGSGGSSAVGNNGWVEVVQADGTALTEAGYVRGNTSSVWTRQDTSVGGAIGITAGFWAYSNYFIPRVSVYSGKSVGDGTQAQEEKFYQFTNGRGNFFYSQAYMGSSTLGGGDYSSNIAECEFFYGLATTADDGGSSSTTTPCGVTVLSGEDESGASKPIADYIGFYKPNGETKVYFVCGDGNTTKTLTSQTYEDTGWDFASTLYPEVIPLGFLTDQRNAIYVYVPASPSAGLATPWNDVQEPRLASIVSTNVPEGDRMRPTIAIRRTATTYATNYPHITFMNYVLGMQISAANYNRRP
jgi:hypothetical protein